MEGVIRTAVCFFCHDGEGRYLIVKRSAQCRDEQGMWSPGGGGLKFGERIEEAVHREVEEELGAKPLELDFMGYRDVFRTVDGKETHWLQFDFRVRVNPEHVHNNEPHKCDGLRWITIEELRELQEPLHSQFPFYLEKYRNRLL